MPNWNRMSLPLTLMMGVAAAAPALPGTSVAETALQAALTTPAAPAAVSSQTSVQASIVVPVKAAPTPIPSTVATAPSKAVYTVAAPVKATVKAVIKPAKPKPSAAQLRQQAIAQAQAAAPRRSARSVVAHATAYNSFASQTDASPTITATGTRVRFGVIALSHDLLRVFPYGSKVMIEDLSGRYSRMLAGKVFVVEDTMHPRMYNTVDVWMPTMGQALQWGSRNVRITAVQ